VRADRGTLANVIALALAGAASLLLLVMPVYRSERSSAVLDAGAEAWTAITTVSHTTPLQQNGPAVLLALGAPVFITLAPFILRRVTRRLLWRLAPAILLTAFCILTGFSIGLFYMPAAVALWIAEVLPPGEPPRP
jgi:DMSO reductase anchor subunit